jgi:hypothetical protein
MASNGPIAFSATPCYGGANIVNKIAVHTACRAEKPTQNGHFSKDEKWVKLDIRNKACIDAQSASAIISCVRHAKLTAPRSANSVRSNPRIRR